MNPEPMIRSVLTSPYCAPDHWSSRAHLELSGAQQGLCEVPAGAVVSVQEGSLRPLQALASAPLGQVALAILEGLIESAQRAR